MNLKNQQQQNDSILQKIQNSLKLSLFQVIYYLLQEEEISLITAIFIQIIEFLQIVSFQFTSINKKLWNSNTVTDLLEKFLTRTLFYTYIKDFNWQIYIIVFYVQVLLIIIFLGLLYYVSQSSKQKLNFQWLSTVLKYFLIYLMSVLYLPFIDYFLNIFKCSKLENDTSNKQYHQDFKDIECWVGQHISHAFVSIFFSLVLIFISLKIVVIYFDGRLDSQDPTNRNNGYFNYNFTIYKTLLAIIFTLLGTEQFSYIIVGIILSGSIILFQQVYFNSPFNNQIYQKMWKIVIGLNLWTSSCLLIGILFEGKFFEGTVVIWMIGFPCIIIYICISRNENVDFLIANVRTLLQLIQDYQINEQSTIILDGYYEIHKQLCNKKECAILTKNNNPKIQRIVRQIQINNSNITKEKQAILIYLVYQMLSEGINIFPNNIIIKIEFVYLLIEKMKFNQIALHELLTAEEHFPSYDVQFVIFRLKYVIEDEIIKQNKKNKLKASSISNSEELGALDIINEMRYQDSFNSLKQNIDISSEAHMEFWTQLSEEAPDLQKVYTIGRKIYKQKIKVVENWQKLIKICNKRPKSIILYANYLMDILNDNFQGQQLLNKVNFLNSLGRNNFKSINIQEKNNDSQPIIIISLESDKLGLIINTNLSSCAFFGYTKTELINRKINTLMPSLFSEYHDAFIENYLNNNELTTLKDERHFFTLNKSGYAQPAFLNVKAFESLINGQQMIGQFRYDKAQKSICYFIVNESGIINNLTGTCISYLSIDQKYIQQKDNILDAILPNLWKNRDEYSLKQGHIFNFKPYQDFGGFPAFKSGRQKFLTFKVNFQEIIVLKDKFLGFIIKMEMDKTKLKPNYNENSPNKKQSVIYRSYYMSFSFVQEKYMFKGENILKTFNTEIESNNNLELRTKNQTQTQVSPSNFQSEEVNNQSNFQKQEEIEEKEDPHFVENSNIKPTLFHKICQQRDIEIPIWYDKGIKTIRLYKNKLTDMQQFKDSDEENQESNDEEVEQDNIYKGGLHFMEENIKLNKNFDDIFTQKQKLNEVINAQIIPQAIKILNILVKFLLFVLLALSFTDYFIVQTQLDTIKNYIQLISYSNKRLTDLNYVEGNIRDLVLLNMGLYTQQEIGNEESIKEDIKKIISQIDSMTSYLQLNSNNLSNEFNDLLNNNNIKIYQSREQYEFRDINDSTQQMIANALFIANSQIEEISNESGDVFFYSFNIFNDYQIHLQECNFYYSKELQDIILSKAIILFVILILTPVFIILDLLIFLPVLIYANKQSMQIIYLFLEIPNSLISDLQIQCQTFIFQVRADDNDEDIQSVQSLKDLDYFQDDNQQKSEKGLVLGEEGLTKKKKKKFVNIVKDNSYLITTKMLIGILILEIYFITNYFLTQKLLNDVHQYVPEMNYTFQAESLYSFADNVQRKMFINSDFPILKQDSIQVCLENIRKLFKLDSDILYEHSQNINIHTEQYNKDFIQIMTQNSCPYLLEKKLIDNIDECNQFAKGSVKSGMSVAFIRYFEDIRQLLTFYQQIIEGDKNVFPQDFETKSILKDKTKNHVLNLLRLPITKEIKQMQRTYISNTLRKLSDSFQSSIESKINEEAQIRFILFLIFLLAIFLLYYLFWYPIQYSLTEEIFKTRSLLTAIPLHVVKQVKPVQIYVQYLYQIYQKQEKDKNKQQKNQQDIL